MSDRSGAGVVAAILVLTVCVQLFSWFPNIIEAREVRS